MAGIDLLTKLARPAPGHQHECPTCGSKLPCQPTFSTFIPNGIRLCWMLPVDKYPCLTCRPKHKVVILDRIGAKGIRI